MDGWIEVKTCPFCASKDLRQYKQVHTAPFLSVPFCSGNLPVLTVTNYVECLGCGLVIQSPRMTDGRIREYYSSGVYRATLGLSQDAMDRDEHERADGVAEWILRRISPSSHLDIGSSRGYLLQNMNAPHAVGFDENPDYSLDERFVYNPESLDRYEIVTAIHVLEHTPDPMRELVWYKSLSTRYVLIEVPGAHCRGGPLRFAHLFYFPERVLSDMMTAAGLRVVEIAEGENTRILAEVQ